MEKFKSKESKFRTGKYFNKFNHKNFNIDPTK